MTSMKFGIAVRAELLFFPYEIIPTHWRLTRELAVLLSCHILMVPIRWTATEIVLPETAILCFIVYGTAATALFGVDVPLYRRILFQSFFLALLLSIGLFFLFLLKQF